MMTELILLLLLSIVQLAVTQQCNQYQFDTPFFPGTSCEDIYNKNPQSRDMSGYYWILDGPSKVYCGMNYTGPTCEDIYLNNEATRDKPGYYRNSSNYWTFCDMNLTRSELFSLGLVSFGSGSGVAGVWRRIANFNISAGDNCPSPWVETTYNGGNYCVPADTNRGCYSVFYSTNGTSYQQVAGRGSVYAKDTLDGFWPSANTNAGIDSYYVDGLSITHGDPRQHIWTYAFGPGYDNNPPTFVGTNYHYYTSSRTNHDLIWFDHQLSEGTQDDIEVRICTDEAFDNEAILIANLELYIIYVQ